MSRMEANCWTGGVIGRDEIAAFVGFWVSPMRDMNQQSSDRDEHDGETRFEVCDARDAEVWSISGLDGDGIAELLHDADTPSAAWAFLNGAMMIAGEKPVRFSDDSWSSDLAPLPAVVDAMTNGPAADRLSHVAKIFAGLID